MRDLVPGTQTSARLWSIATNKGRTFFALDDMLYGQELWTTDGTAEGTRLVKDIAPGNPSSKANNLYPFKNGVLFDAMLDTQHWPVFFSDGTAEGTIQLTAGDQRDGESRIGQGACTSDGTRAWFTANFGRVHERGYEISGTTTDLVMTDGTRAGTKRIPGTTGVTTAQYHDGHVYMVLNGGTENTWLAKMSANGDTPVKLRKFPHAPKALCVALGRLFFVASDGLHGDELWVTDGTADGTRMLKDLNGTQMGSIGHFDPVEHNGRIYFNGYDADGFKYLACSDGTEDGTMAVSSPLIAGGRFRRSERLTVWKDKLFFWAEDPGTPAPINLFMFDGTSFVRVRSPRVATKHFEGTSLRRQYPDNVAWFDMDVKTIKYLFTFQDRLFLLSDQFRGVSSVWELHVE
jgi:ELWxxDGT repeat protein